LVAAIIQILSRVRSVRAEKLSAGLGSESAGVNAFGKEPPATRKRNASGLRSNVEIVASIPMLGSRVRAQEMCVKLMKPLAGSSATTNYRKSATLGILFADAMKSPASEYPATMLPRGRSVSTRV
jgi:hypothetical protein